jgi:uncharacterized membrane protein YphA (DoxX/SURF4 family)
MMKIDKYKEYAPLIARVSISLVFLWFGFNEILNTEAWVTWLPQFAYNLPIAPTTLVLINGIFEVIFGGLLLLGLFTRVASFLLFIHLMGIVFSVGYNDVAIRDLGLSLVTLSIFLSGPDKWCLDKRGKRN